MVSIVKVGAPPEKAVMIYDGDCDFCSLWIHRWHQTAGDGVDFLPFQDDSVSARFPEVPRGQFENAVQLVEKDGQVYAGAEAVFRALAHKRHKEWLLAWYEQSPLFAHACEWGYRLVARHRGFFSVLTHLAWGRHTEPPTYQLVRAVFLRCLGIIYAIAFVSLWGQIIGLVGRQGLLPANPAMAAIRLEADIQHVGLDRYHLLPTLCWFSASDGFLVAQCAAGTALAVLVIFDIAPALCLFLLWLIYLSLTTICRDFMAFQWDNLLLEVGFLAIFVAPLRLRRGRTPTAPPSRLVLWLLRWLLFKLIFQSGCVKLLSGDPAWRNLSALKVHYETQPLPTWIAWYAHQLPGWFQAVSTAFVLIVEVAVPFLIFAPRRPRHWAFGALVLLQVLIFLTGNYCFFNLLAIALCLLLLDDAALRRLVPGGRASRRAPALVGDEPRADSPLPALRWPLQVTVPLAVIAVGTALVQFGGIFRLSATLPRPVVAVYRWLEPFRTFNHYGLFAIMTTVRREIIIEGSNDGSKWLPYEFKYKPGDVKRRPRFVEPHQPRLDWQMWFAALGDIRQNPWLINCCLRLLQSSPPVQGLFKRDPFDGHPPRYIRAVLYDYHFTNWSTRRRTGAWWSRSDHGLYLPPISLPSHAPSEASADPPV